MESTARPARAPVTFLLACLAAGPVAARADSAIPGFDPSSFADPVLQLVGPIADTLVTTLGIATDHRPFEPATAMGASPGLSFGLDLVLAKPSPKFGEELAKVGVSGAKNLPVIPVPRLQVRKGFGETLSIGASGIKYQGYSVFGGDAQLTVSQPEEGPTWAIRLSYAHAELGMVKTSTWTPQVLVSRALEFADPYLGVGYELVNGTLHFSTEVSGYQVSIERTASGRAAIAFIGLQLRVPGAGLQLALEGAYNSYGMHTLGTKIGFRY